MELLAQWAGGDAKALEELTRLVHRELKQLAAAYMRKERLDHTLQPTALVNEAYVRLLSQKNAILCQNRSHFLAIAARLMRQILVDHARKRHAGKRFGEKAELGETIASPSGNSTDLLSLDDGLRELEKVDPRKCRTVEMRYFSGLSVDEIATTLDVTSRTVRRDLAMAEAWLYQRLSNRGPA